MMKLKNLLVLAGVAVVMSLTGNLSAQDNNTGGNANSGGQSANGGGGRGGRGGNFDPAQFQQRILDRVREQMAVKGEDEWKIISERVTKVLDARIQTFGGFGRGGRSGFGSPSPEAEALQKAIDSKASVAEMKATLTKLRESRKVKQAALEKAQADLQKVLSVQQEAIAVLNGLLN